MIKKWEVAKMTTIKIILCVLALAFTLFGYFIFFKNKYSLINDFGTQGDGSIVL